MAKDDGNWIQKALPESSKGKLKRKLHVKADKKIPVEKLIKAEHSKSPTLKKEAVLAKTLRKINKK